MRDETTTAEQPIGLYYDPRSGQYAGAIDPIQAEAMVRLGFELHTEGRDAAMTSQEDIDVLKGIGDTLPAGGETYEPTLKDKKGKS